MIDCLTSICQEIITNMKDWQTLISAIIALIAAILTIATMHCIEYKKIARERISVKCNLHLIASDLTRKYEECYTKLKKVYKTSGTKVNLTFPENEIQQLVAGIKYLDTPSAKFVEKFIEKNQLFYARSKIKETPYSYCRLIELLEIYALLTPFYDYSRNDIKKLIYIKPQNKDLKSALNIMEQRKRTLGTSTSHDGLFQQKAYDEIDAYRPT